MAKHNVLKKVIPLVAGIGIVAAGASNVVSCVAPQYAAGIDGQRVLVATDGGHINDHSFNEDAYIGVKKFVKDTYNLDGKNNYVEAGGTDDTSIISGYRLAITKKANAVVLPGFSHMNTLPSILPEFHKHHVNTILVDGVVQDPDVVSLQFNSQISGVMAGFDTSYLFGTTYENGKLVYDTNGDGKIRIGTFAGASNKYGVDNYMWGLLLGMQIYNDVADIHNKDSKDKWALSESANLDSGQIKDIKVQSNTDPDWYSNSFDLGAATKAGIPGKLIDKWKADVVFPVAGPQIQDVLSYGSKAKKVGGKDPYVIGIDVDQEAAYASSKGRFVTAAIKNIDTAVPEALYRAHHKNNKDNTVKPVSDEKSSNGTGVLTDTGKTSFDKTKDDNNAWLGTQPNPFVNWSIDYTDYNTPTDQGQGRYLLKHNYLGLFDPKNTEVTAQFAMAEINDHFAKLGIEAPDYMKGDDIYSFAAKLVSEYGSDWEKGPEDGSSEQYQQLNWNKAPKAPSNK